MMKKQGFTLAEVLITLGIIGVVAAMTIPTLISNTNGAQFKTAYKKALSTLNQAVLMNVALEDYDLSSLAKADADKQDGSVNKSMAYILKQRMQSATDITSTYTFPDKITYYITEDDTTTSTDVTPTTTNFAVYAFADGTTFGYNINAENCGTKGATNCQGFIDVNGATNPNQVIACTDGTEGDGDCEVAASGITDVYPVWLYGQTIEPASDAARAVLFGK